MTHFDQLTLHATHFSQLLANLEIHDKTLELGPSVLTVLTVARLAPTVVAAWCRCAA